MGFLILILFFAVFIFIIVKINNFRERLREEMLRGTGASTAEIDATIGEGIEKKQIKKFLDEHPDFTEETIKNLLKEYIEKMINKDLTDEFSQSVREKLQKDSKLEKLKDMQFKRINISFYGNSKLSATVIYSDNRDEYIIHLGCSTSNNLIQVIRYEFNRGRAIGF